MPALFPILLEVEEVAVGSVLRLLKGYPGIAGLHLDLDGIGKKISRRMGEKKSKANGNGQAEADHVDRPPLKTIIIGAMLSGPKNLDFLETKVKEFWPKSTKGSISQTLYALKKQEIIRKVGVGVYELTPEALAKMQVQPVAEPASPAAPQLAAPHKKHDRSATRPWVLAQVAEGLSRSEMRNKGAPLGISDRMIDGALTRMKKEKVILAGTEPGRFKVAPGKKPGVKS